MSRRRIALVLTALIGVAAAPARAQMSLLGQTAQMPAVAPVAPPPSPDRSGLEQIDPPEEPRRWRFDVATLLCDQAGEMGLDQPDRQLCLRHFAALNDNRSRHVMAVGTQALRPWVWQQGNFCAVYVNDLNTGINRGGALHADEVWARAVQDFPDRVPRWFIVNEISAGRWPDDAAYRQLVIDFVRRLAGVYQRKVVVLVPFAAVHQHREDWSALAKSGYVCAENYLSGEEVARHGYSIEWCRQQYERSIASYGAMGVPLDRLLLVEHYGNSLPGTAWGRAGLPFDAWRQVVIARGLAIAQLHFAGAVSYGWAGNSMHVPDADRLAIMDTYASLPLP